MVMGFSPGGCIKYSSLLFKKDQLFKKGPIVKQDIYLVLVLERKGYILGYILRIYPRIYPKERVDNWFVYDWYVFFQNRINLATHRLF